MAVRDPENIFHLGSRGIVIMTRCLGDIKFILNYDKYGKFALFWNHMLGRHC